MFLQPERPRPSGPKESFKRKLQQNGVDQCGVAARRYTAGCCYRICGCLLIPFATSERVWKIGRLNNITTADSLSTESSKTNSCDLSTTFSLMNQTSASRVLGRRLRTTYTLQGENCSEVHEKLDKLLSLDLLKHPKRSYEFKTKSPWQFSVSFESRAFSRWHRLFVLGTKYLFSFKINSEYFYFKLFNRNHIFRSYRVRKILVIFCKYKSIVIKLFNLIASYFGVIAEGVVSSRVVK